jgi:hypothetical protein
LNKSISTQPPFSITLRSEQPDFLDLPWSLPLGQWAGRSQRLEEVARGLSRHPVVFANYTGVLYALKELPGGLAEKEFNLLRQMESARLPVVSPVGHVRTETLQGPSSVLITRFLERSLPYRSLFMSDSLERYRDHLLDAISGLLVQLHLAGMYWGDCSLSNTLFRRDAGALQAYLVDAETAEVYPERLPPTLRYQELEIMEENVDNDLVDLQAEGLLPQGRLFMDVGASIRLRYQSLWEEITRQELVGHHERYRIQERIRALNGLGFSIREVLLEEVEIGQQLRFRVSVTDRNFHRDQLASLTGIEAEERQARQMMNEIHELQATLSPGSEGSTPLSAAAYHWLENIYRPAIERLAPILGPGQDLPEMYCQVLEHKWYLSERASQDVGHQTALEDYINNYLPRFDAQLRLF